MEQELLKKLEKSADTFEAKAAQIDSLKTTVDALPGQIKSIETTVDGLKNSVQEITSTKTAVDSIKSTVDEVKSDAKVTHDAVDKLLADVKALTKQSAGNERKESFKESLGTAFKAKEAQLKSYKNDRNPLNFDVKVVGDIASGSFAISGTQGFVNPTMVLPVGRKPYETRHVRELLRITPVTTGDSIYAVRDSGGEGGPTAVSVGSTKPQSDRDYVKLVVPITKIAHYYRIPEEYLEDIDFLTNEISAVGVEELLSKEDDMILNNTTAGQFQGLTTATNSTTAVMPSSLTGQINYPNNYDVLVGAWTQLRTAKVTGVNGVLVNPEDYTAMILSKASTGEYPFGAPNIAIPNIFGIPVFPHTAIAVDSYLMGDFSQVALTPRAAISVRFYDQDQDNAIKNLVTVVIEERIAVVSGRSDKLVFGYFSDGRQSISSGVS